MGFLPYGQKKIVRANSGEEGKYQISGYEMPASEIVKLTADTLILKVPGQSVWRGRGFAQGYAPAEYQIFDFIGVGADGETLIVAERTSIEIKAKALSTEEVKEKAEKAMARKALDTEREAV